MDDAQHATMGVKIYWRAAKSRRRKKKGGVKEGKRVRDILSRRLLSNTVRLSFMLYLRAKENRTKRGEKG